MKLSRNVSGAKLQAALLEYRIMFDRVANISAAASKEKRMSRRVAIEMELLILCADHRALRTKL